MSFLTVVLDNRFPILDLAKTIMKVNGKSLEIKMDPSKPDIPTTVILNCKKAKELLGWEPVTSLEEGLKKTSQWYTNVYRDNT